MTRYASLFHGELLMLNFGTDTLPVHPSRSELQATIPAGRSAVAVKPYQSPTPAFGPGSVEHTRRQAESLELELEELEGDNIELCSKAPGSPPSSNTSSYAGAGSYF